LLKLCSLDGDDDANFKIDKADGPGREFLRNQQEDPRQDANHARQFVRGLIHASLRDGDGYVKGLTEKTVNSFIDDIFSLNMC